MNENAIDRVTHIVRLDGGDAVYLSEPTAFGAVTPYSIRTRIGHGDRLVGWYVPGSFTWESTCELLEMPADDIVVNRDRLLAVQTHRQPS